MATIQEQAAEAEAQAVQTKERCRDRDGEATRSIEERLPKFKTSDEVIQKYFGCNGDSLGKGDFCHVASTSTCPASLTYKEPCDHRRGGRCNLLLCRDLQRVADARFALRRAARASHPSSRGPPDETCR